jgi:hypothetical protein
MNMTTKMVKALGVAAVLGMSALMASGTAQAVPIVGTEALSGSAAIITGTDLSNASELSFSFFGTANALGADGNSGTGDLAGHTSIVSASHLVLAPASFSFTAAGYGTFTDASIIITKQTASNLDVFLLGDFNPDFGGFSDGPASFELSLTENCTQSGCSISASGTLASPPASVVPEPMTVALLGAGLAGVGFMRRKSA